MQNVQGLSPNQVFMTMVPDGDAGTIETLGFARQLVEECMQLPEIRALALKYLRQFGAASGDKLGELYAIFQGTLKDFYFRDDPAGTEMLQPVLGILEGHAGDCDDLNLILLPSLLGSIGFATRGVVVKADRQRPDEFSHVYMEAQLPDGTWFPMDIAREKPRFGLAPEHYWGRADYPLTPTSSFGLGDLQPFRQQRGQPLMVRVRLPFPRRARFARRGLGQDGEDGGDDTLDTVATDLAQEAPSLLTSSATLVKAINTPGIPYSGSGLAVPETVITPTSEVSTGGAVLGTSSLSGGTILIVLVIGGLALAMGGH